MWPYQRDGLRVSICIYVCSCHLYIWPASQTWMPSSWLLPGCLSVWLPVSSPGCMCVCLPVCRPLYLLCAYLLACSTVGLFVCLSDVCLFLFLPISLLVHLNLTNLPVICLSVCLSVLSIPSSYEQKELASGNETLRKKGWFYRRTTKHRSNSVASRPI